MDLSILKKERAVIALIEKLKEKLKYIKRTLNIMEVCGTHTMTAYRSGLGKVMREMGINLISGPGCPVCVTSDRTISTAAYLVKNYSNLILATFGDMARVPTSEGPLMKVVPAENSEVKVVYSTEEVLKLARANPEKEVVFLAAGFETTIPSIAYLVKKAKEENLKNISLISAMKLVPPPLKVILDAKEIALDGFIYPGHVSVIIGSKPYRFIAEDYGIPGAITGFEPVDLIMGVMSIVEQISDGRAEVDIVYKRAVKPDGNPVARKLMEEVFHVGDAEWRGFGVIPESGMYPEKEFMAEERFSIGEFEVWENRGCRCAEVVRGVAEPEECPLFGKVCTPESPMGACMVSVEGVCLIHYKYGREVPFEAS